MKKPENPEAFPRFSIDKRADGSIHNLYTESEGMTLLDYFAGQVLMGEFACQSEGWETGEKEDQWGYIIKKSYRVAKAMLEEREEYNK